MINIKMIARSTGNANINTLTMTYTRDEVEQMMQQAQADILARMATSISDSATTTLTEVDTRIATATANSATSTLTEVDTRIATATANKATVTQMDAANTAIATIKDDEVTTLTPTTKTGDMILRSAYDGSVKYDLYQYSTNYNTYLYEVNEGDILDVVVAGTAYGSATFLGGAWYNDSTTVDHTTAVDSAWNNADIRYILGHSRLTAPTGAKTLAITQSQLNTVTVKRLNLSRLGAVEDMLANNVTAYNEHIPPFYDGQHAYDSATGNVYMGVNGAWVMTYDATV